jgi:hypothetical protein
LSGVSAKKNKESKKRLKKNNFNGKKKFLLLLLLLLLIVELIEYLEVITRIIQELESAYRNRSLYIADSSKCRLVYWIYKANGRIVLKERSAHYFLSIYFRSRISVYFDLENICKVIKKKYNSYKIRKKNMVKVESIHFKNYSSVIDAGLVEIRKIARINAVVLKAISIQTVIVQV